MASDQLRSCREFVVTPSGPLRHQCRAVLGHNRFKLLHELLTNVEADAVAANRVAAPICIREATKACRESSVAMSRSDKGKLIDGIHQVQFSNAQ